MPASQEMTRNMLASASCVGTAVVIFNPLDCWRVRWQVQKSHLTMAGHLRSILTAEGLLQGLWLPAVGYNAAAAALCRGVGMGIYPAVRDSLGKVFQSEHKTGGTMFLAGLLSGGIGYGLSTPLWQLKTRRQAGLELKGHRESRGLWGLLRTAGLAGAYRGAGPLVVRGALMNAGNTLGYDGCKTFAREYKLLPDGPVLHTVASVVAALLSSTLSVPADLVMTRYQTASQMGYQYAGVLDCVSTLLRTEGLMSFFRGWVPLFGRVAPLYVVYLPAYEQVRRALGLDYLQ